METRYTFVDKLLAIVLRLILSKNVFAKFKIIKFWRIDLLCSLSASELTGLTFEDEEILTEFLCITLVDTQNEQKNDSHGRGAKLLESQVVACRNVTGQKQKRLV